MKDFRQELYENGYFRQEELCFADCDRYQRARVSGLLNKAAAYAGYDYNARGLTHDVLFEMGEVFLLSRMAMRIHRIPMAGEVLDIATYENGVKGAHMQRVYEMKDQTGEVRVSVKSDWILVNPATRKIMRPSAFTAKPIQTCDRVIDCPDPKKLLLPHEGVEELGTRQVVWSDLDGNGSTTDDRSEVTYSVELTGKAAGEILRNGYYRIAANNTGLVGQDCAVTVTVADWETPVTQSVELGA